MKNAIGIVQNTAKVPHGLPINALTTTKARTVKDDYADQENADARNSARNRSHLGTSDIAQRTTIAPGRQKQDRHVLDRTGKHRSGENPQRTRQITHLRGKYRTYQWTGAGNRRETMAVEHISIGRDVIETVVVAIGGRWPRALDAERPVGNKQIGYEINADYGDDEPRGINRFAPI